MFVSVDRSRMGFLYRHPDMQALLDIAWIESGTNRISIVPCDEVDGHTFGGMFTDLELRLLYRNTTGEGWGALSEAALKTTLAQLGAQVPLLTHNLIELRLQADHIPEGDPAVYQFVPGKRKPAVPQELFQVPLVRVSRNPAAEQQAQQEAAQRAAAPPAPQGLPLPSVTQTRPSAPRSAPSAPPSNPAAGSVTDRIYAKGDVMWEAAGKPSEQAALKALRKQVIVALVADGINSNSASKGSGMWLKARFNM